MSDLVLEGKKIEFVSQEVDVIFQVASGVSTGTMFHDLLNNRDSADQHPIEAITGLTGAITGFIGELNNKQDSDDLDQVDNTSDVNKPVSVAVNDELSKKADSSSVDQINNTSDANKPVSDAQQAALDGKMASDAFDEINNTSDADKPVSIAQQVALDLKLNIADWYNSFDNSQANSFTVASVEPAYEEVGRVTMLGLVAGTYQVTVAGRVQADTLGRKAFVRWSVDGGATWEDPVAYNVLDVTDKKPFTHIDINVFTGGDRVVIVQAAKASGVGSMIINKLDIVCGRKA